MKDEQFEKSVGVMVVLVCSFFVWLLVSYAPLYLVLLLTFTFGEMPLTTGCEPWLRGFRLSLARSCRVHAAEGDDSGSRVFVSRVECDIIFAGVITSVVYRTSFFSSTILLTGISRLFI